MSFFRNPQNKEPRDLTLAERRSNFGAYMKAHPSEFWRTEADQALEEPHQPCLPAGAARVHVPRRLAQFLR